MKKMLVMAAFMLSSVCAFAQHEVGSFTLQPKVGLNIAGLTDAEGSDSRIGFAGGVEAEYQITDMISVTGGLIYSMQGMKYTETFDDGDGEYNVDVTTKLDYINIPILANVYVAKGLAVKLGIQPAFKVSSKESAEGISADVDAKGFDFSIPVGVSYEYSNVVLDARYNWGLTKVADYSDSKNSVFQITLGYKFAL